MATLEEDLTRAEECLETRRRVQVAVWAYAYEVYNNPIVSDAKFDEVCKQIDINKPTNNPKMDDWFRKYFSPDTGMWIHEHPEKGKLQRIYQSIIFGRGQAEAKSRVRIRERPKPEAPAKKIRVREAPKPVRTVRQR